MKTAQICFLLPLLMLFFFLRLADSANILGIFLYTFSTPYMFLTPYIRALIGNGHNITIISSAGIIPHIKGVRHIGVPELDQVIYSIINFNFTDDYLVNIWKAASLRANFLRRLSESVLNDERVNLLIHDKNEHFDMILMDPLQASAMHGFAEHFDAIQVGLVAFGSNWLVDYLAGNSAPSVYRPMSTLGYSSGDSLLDRWNNWIYIAQEWLVERLVLLPPQVELFKHYFHFSADRFHTRRRNFSLMLINQHFSLGRARSNSPNIIEVAGMHMAQEAPDLDKELQKFLDEAEDGVIYFSMGLEILNRWLPENLQQTLLETFSQLKQRIVWKHELANLANKSDNIYLSSITSQRKLLQHPNTKLFITHGGLLSLIEAAYAGVPMLGLPIYFDQFDNVERMRMLGAAQKLDANTITVKQLTDNIMELLHNPNYTLKAKEISHRFRDQPMAPLENAIWWTEYVIRHQGAPHMRLPEQDFAFMSYYGLNIISVLCGRIGFSVMIIIFLIYSVVKAILTLTRKNSCTKAEYGLRENVIYIDKIDRKEKVL